MPPRQVPDWLTRWEYAHRGLHSAEIPENSLEAAGAAIQAGMGIECDIQRSCDGAPMVFHDWELERLTHERGPTDKRSLAELEQMQLKGGTGHIPSLSALLHRIDGAVPLLIEVKSKPDYLIEPSCVAVHEELKGYSGDCAVMSFDPRVSEWFGQNAPEIVRGLVMREDRYGHTQTFEEREAAFLKAEPDFLAYHVAAVSNSWVQNLRERGLPVLTWTVNSASTREVGLAHADALICEGEGLA